MTALDPTARMLATRPLPNAPMPQRNTPDQAKALGEKFEAMFLGQMLQHMSAGLQPNPIFGGGHGEEVFRSLLMDEHAKGIAQRGGIGIADAVARQILRTQEIGQR